MKKLIVVSVLSASLVLSATPISYANTDLPYVKEILALQPDVTEKELLKDVESISKNTGDKQEAILEQLFNELKQDEAQGLSEKKLQARGGSGGTVSVGTGVKGQIYYTASQTAYLNHGHVGMYYNTETVVESVPKVGVRSLHFEKRLVDKGDAQVKSVNTSTANRNAAADWAKSRVGKDDYSYNFANNRNTSHTGDKNCAKLVWSAYKLKADLDLDKDKGLGVYPRDVRDAKDTTLVRKI
ncbi:YiiX/YebB-like N1pC/P60 family cysteine hydrolase [Gottfriedia acidiceleris]|uniref:YiiX/YebB-like N1pC/P60 family cysteine hydrolase n=1 Tax=Gottfriedia acidiceleris TaxID=371036 RepID=UPI00101CE80A|nr:YiiX/YebB-like N1pC/P60 family cysteine hydrolase [Gottfriedia acidiceleris]